jgi:hypothetical protein
MSYDQRPVPQILIVCLGAVDSTYTVSYVTDYCFLPAVLNPWSFVDTLGGVRYSEA